VTRLAKNHVQIWFDVSTKLELVSVLESKMMEMLCVIYRRYGKNALWINTKTENM